MTFTADYPGAIVVEAAKYGYPPTYPPNNPKAWCLHTPEEPPDDEPSTPYYFHNLTDRDASTHYFVSYLGFVFQMVPERYGAYANAVEGKPYPPWAGPTVNLNLQTINMEIEGYAGTIHRTMPRGSPQWRAVVDLMAHRCAARGIPPERTFGHYEVSIYRSDPGLLDIPGLVLDVKAKMEDNMAKLIRIPGGAIWATDGIFVRDMGGVTADAKKVSGDPVDVSQEYADRLIRASQLALKSDIGSGSGLSIAEVVAAVKRALKEGTG